MDNFLSLLARWLLGALIAVGVICAIVITVSLTLLSIKVLLIVATWLMS